MKAEKKPSEIGQCKTESNARSLPKPHFTGSNFDFLYDSFHQPLANVISNEGEMIGLTKDGELKPFEHTKTSKEVENDLAQHANARNMGTLEVKIVSYYKMYKDELNEPLKYILSFYKVSFDVSGREYWNT